MNIIFPLIDGPRASLPNYDSLLVEPRIYNYPRQIHEQLIIRQNHMLSAVEIKCGFHDTPDTTTGHYTHNSTYFIVDRTDKEILVLNSQAKGYVGTGPRTALSIDTYLDLFNIPIARRTISRTGIPYDKPITVNTPTPRKSSFTLKKLDTIMHRMNRLHFQLDGVGLDALRQDGLLEDKLNAVDFSFHGQYYGTTGKSKKNSTDKVSYHGMQVNN